MRRQRPSHGDSVALSASGHSKDPRAGHTQIADPCIGVVAASGTEGPTRGLRGCQLLCACPSDPHVACRRARPDLPLARFARVVVGLCGRILRARRYAWPLATIFPGFMHPWEGTLRPGRERLRDGALLMLAGLGVTS